MKNNSLIFFTRKACINTNLNPTQPPLFKGRSGGVNPRRFVKKKFVGRAFTLVEILIAIFVLEIGLLGIAAFYSYSFKISKIARNETTAANLASGVLDEDLSISYDNLPVGAGTKTRYSTDASDPFYEWYKKVDIAYINSSLTESASDTNMKKIIVTIYWEESGSEKSFQTASIKAKH